MNRYNDGCLLSSRWTFIWIMKIFFDVRDIAINLV